MIRFGDCVRLADGRVGRVRAKSGALYKIRVRRKTSNTHQFVTRAARELQLIRCPKEWMSPDGYRRYLRATLSKMRLRQSARQAKRGA